MAVVLLIGMAVFARFVPPPSPLLTADQIGAIYAEKTTGIRVGMVIMASGASLLAPFIAMITVQMKRIEGARSPLSYIQLALGALTVLEFIIPAFISLAATFRPERSPEITQALNDLCWLMFVGVVSTAILQNLAIAVAIFCDDSDHPVFPRWAAYFNLWAALLFTPGTVVVFFKTGPLAWNGVFTWWIPLSMFVGWIGVMTWLLLSAIGRDDVADHPTKRSEDARSSTVDSRVRLDELADELESMRVALGL